MLNLLKFWCDEGKDIYSELFMMIMDVEMLEMDGYKLIYEICNDLCMKDFFIIFNILFSGSFNEVMV